MKPAGDPFFGFKDRYVPQSALPSLVFAERVKKAVARVRRRLSRRT